MGLLALINIAGAAQGLVLAGALAVRRRGSVGTHRTLAALVFCLSLFVLGAVSTTTRFYLAYPHVSFAHDPFVFLCTPLLFLYVRALLTERPLAWRDVWHFVPAAALFVGLLPYYLQSAEAKREYLQHEHAVSFTPYFYIRSSLAIVQGVLYVGAIALLVHRLGGIRKVTSRSGWRAIALFIASIATALAIRFADVFGLLPTIETNLLFPLCITILMLYAAFSAIRRDARPLELWPDERPVRYGSSTLTPERAERYLVRLRVAMENEQLFRDGDLTLHSLAATLGLPVPHVSQVINEHLGQTFSEFVASYRVSFAQAALLDRAKAHFSVLAIGQEAGFSSKSSFNAVFKKQCGMTPSEYRRARRPEPPTHP